MINKPQLAVSLLSADILSLGNMVESLVDAGCQRLHLDVMDQHYVDNFTFGPLVCGALRQRGYQVSIDVHLMVKPAAPLIASSIQAGATSILFHPDASDDVRRDLQRIKQAGIQAGLVLNPQVPLDDIMIYLPYCDMILIMTVMPGFGGQTFIMGSLDKISMIFKYLKRHNFECQLMVDGGIDMNNAHQVVQAGGSIIVSGSGVFGYEDGYVKGFSMLQEAINGIEPGSMA